MTSVAHIVAAAPSWPDITTAVLFDSPRHSKRNCARQSLSGTKTTEQPVLAVLSERWEDPYIYEGIRLTRRLTRAGTIKLITDLYGPDVAAPDLDKMELAADKTSLN